MTKMQFRDRAHAGLFLAERLSSYRGRTDLIVLALPRGGVPVGYEVAQALEAPMDVFIVRKLGVPGYEELAMGAIARGGHRVLNPEVVAALGENVEAAIERVTSSEEKELVAREQRYRAGRPFPDLHERCVILVDDGLATGATMRVAARAVRDLGAAQIIIAVPVAAASSCREMRQEADAVICGIESESFSGVGQFYEKFDQTTDDEVRALLAQSVDKISG